MAKPQVSMYSAPYPPKAQYDRIDVYQTSLPTRAYSEIALIKCGDTDDQWNMNQILKRAREIGADGVIVVGRAGSYGVGIPVGNMAYAVSEGYGITAIAIKYK